jgi:7-cyano-7-deazaguanine synthase
VILLSGGLDSYTTLGIAIRQGFVPYTLTFRYGQRHDREVHAARRIAAETGVTQHTEVEIDLRQFGRSALTDNIDVPKRDRVEEMDAGIPSTYVPARNTIFLSYALARSETLGTGDIFMGVNSLDYSGYPDCRPQYIRAFERMANLATKAAVEGTCPVAIHAPLIRLTKAEIIRRGLELGLDYGLTSSCYDPTPSGLACAHCDACLLRLRGFAQNGIPDPIAYDRGGRSRQD